MRGTAARSKTSDRPGKRQGSEKSGKPGKSGKAGKPGKPGKRGKRLVGALLPVLPHFVGLVGRLVRDPRVPWPHKGMLAGVLLYVLSPLDLIPDVFGVLGWTDDFFLLGLAIRQLMLGAGAEVVRSNWRGTEESLTRLQSGLDDLGSLLPDPVRRGLEAYASRW